MSGAVTVTCSIIAAIRCSLLLLRVTRPTCQAGITSFLYPSPRKQCGLRTQGLRHNQARRLASRLVLHGSAVPIHGTADAHAGAFTEPERTSADCQGQDRNRREIPPVGNAGAQRRMEDFLDVRSGPKAAQPKCVRYHTDG